LINYFWDNIFKHNRQEKSVENALKNNILFQDLNMRELQLVKNIINVRNYRTGETIFNQGEIGVGMYIIVSGSVDILVEESSVSGEGPQSNFVTRLAELDFFGEIALVEETGRRTATAIAHEETILIGFFKPDLMEIISRHPNIGVKILFGLGRVLGTRLSETTSLIRALKKKVKKDER
jgi:CRP/FNR family transcriptional regulator, cyclic AMP receptor protein